MGIDCLRGISKALNRTNFKVLAWYVDEANTRGCGVKNIRFLM